MPHVHVHVWSPAWLASCSACLRPFISLPDWPKMCIRPAAADAYQQRGFNFDEIWAWELGAVDPTTFWASIPDHIVPKLHFYNSGVDADSKSPANPVNIIRYGGQGRLVSSAATLPIRYTDACRLLVGTALQAAACSAGTLHSQETCL